MIDTPTYVENAQPIADNVGMTGPAQVAATPNQVRTDLTPSQGGRFSSAFPLWDGSGRVLVSWSICRVLEPDPANPLLQIIVPCTPERLADPNVEVAPPLYGIWMYNPPEQTQLPIVTGEEGVLIADVVAAQPRRVPDNIPDKVAGVDVDADLVAQNVGILNIRSVYDVDGVSSVPSIAAVADPVQTPPASGRRGLRLEKAVSIPDEDLVDLANTAFGPNNQLGMRRSSATRRSSPTARFA